MPLELHSRPVFVHSWVGSSSSRFFSEEAASSSTLLKCFSSKQHPMCAFSLTLVAGKSFWRLGRTCGKSSIDFAQACIESREAIDVAEYMCERSWD
jgi:hypothetical protein